MNQSIRTGTHLSTDDLWGLRGVFAQIGEQSKRTIEAVVSPIAVGVEFVMVGIGLGVLGAALVGCAIPILLCISHLPL